LGFLKSVNGCNARTPYRPPDGSVRSSGASVGRIKRILAFATDYGRPTTDCGREVAVDGRRWTVDV
jgi:hypothetical protein